MSKPLPKHSVTGHSGHSRAVQGSLMGGPPPTPEVGAPHPPPLGIRGFLYSSGPLRRWMDFDNSFELHFFCTPHPPASMPFCTPPNPITSELCKTHKRWIFWPLPKVPQNSVNFFQLLWHFALGGKYRWDPRDHPPGFFSRPPPQYSKKKCNLGMCIRCDKKRELNCGHHTSMLNVKWTFCGHI